MLLLTLGSARRIAVITAVIGIALMSVTLPAGAGGSDGCRPKGTFKYASEKISATYTIDLRKCWRWEESGRYEIHARIDRVEGGSPLVPIPGGTKEQDLRCSYDKNCRVTLSMPHPAPELAYYAFEITYEYSPRQSEHQSFSWRCASNPVYSKCDTSVPLPIP